MISIDKNSVEFLIEKSKIIDTIHKYTWALDSHKWDLFDSLFTEDAVLNVLNDSLIGIDSIKEYISKNHANLISQHMVSNFIISIENDQAYSKCHVSAKHKRIHIPVGSRLNDTFDIIGFYNNKLVKVKNEWKIFQKDLKTIWMT